MFLACKEKQATQDQRKTENTAKQATKDQHQI